MEDEIAALEQLLAMPVKRDKKLSGNSWPHRSYR